VVSQRKEVINRDVCLSRQQRSGRSINLSSAGQAFAISTDEVLDVGSGRDHMVSISLNPWLSVQPRKDLLQELVRVALGNAELGDPNRLVEGGVELLEVGLEVLSVVPGVIVGDDEVDLAAVAAFDELLEVVDALASGVGVGDGWGTDTKSLFGEGLDVLLVGCDGSGHVDVGASATDLVWLVEAENGRHFVLLLRSSNVVEPALEAPVLVGVEQGDVFKVDSLAINDRLPVVHPGDLGSTREVVRVLRSSNTVVLFGEGKATLAATACLERRRLRHSG
jgi:hypothetical protein